MKNYKKTFEDGDDGIVVDADVGSYVDRDSVQGPLSPYTLAAFIVTDNGGPRSVQQYVDAVTRVFLHKVSERESSPTATTLPNNQDNEPPIRPPSEGVTGQTLIAGWHVVDPRGGK